MRILGIALLVVGAVLLYMGFQATGSFTEKVSETFTGRYTETTTWYIVGGAAAAVAGLLMTLRGSGRRLT